MGVDRRDPERDLLSVWRWIAIGTCTFLIFFTVVADTLIRAFVNDTFRVSEVLFAALVSSWLVLLGFEGKSIVDRIRGNGNGNGNGRR